MVFQWAQVRLFCYAILPTCFITRIYGCVLHFAQRFVVLRWKFCWSATFCIVAAGAAVCCCVIIIFCFRVYYCCSSLSCHLPPGVLLACRWQYICDTFCIIYYDRRKSIAMHYSVISSSVYLSLFDHHGECAVHCTFILCLILPSKLLKT